MVSVGYSLMFLAYDSLIFEGNKTTLLHENCNIFLQKQEVQKHDTVK